MSEESTVDDAPVVRVDRSLLETWPGRFRFPDVLIGLVTEPGRDGPTDGRNAEGDGRNADGDGDGDGRNGAAGGVELALARAVLSRAGGRPPRAVCEELLERGEFGAAAYVRVDCPDLSAHEREALGRKLEAARAAAGEDVRQRVRELERRAAAAGVTADALDVAALAARAHSRKAAADNDLGAATAALARRLEPLTLELRGWLERQAADATAPRGGPTAKRVDALIGAGELVAARTLLRREPLGSPIPESTTPLPPWNPRWDPDRFLEYHLNPAAARPPEFASWEAADGGKDLLAAYDRLQKDDSARAAEAFADALNRFLGASGRGGVARRVDTSRFHQTYFDGLFGAEALSRLHPTGRVDLYVGGPGTSAVPDLLADQAPHVAVAPGLTAQDYTDRQATAVLSLRDLLRLVVLPDDRAAALLGVLARQWPVTALIGDRAGELAAVLGDEPNTAWRTLRWITHLSLGGGHGVAQAMENGTAMDPASLRVMFRYAEHRAVAAGSDLWSAADGGWQRDEGLVQALQEELVARCGGSAAEAAWWAALAAGDPATGEVSPEDLLLMAEACSDWPEARDQVRAGVDALVGRGLLTRSGDGTGEHLTVPRSGVVRMLRAGAEQQLTGLLARLAHARDEQHADQVAAPAGWTEWERNRYATVSAAERAEAETELRDQNPALLAATSDRSPTDLAPLLTNLTAQCQAQYPDTILDVRCPPTLRVDVPEPVLRAVLYEVLDNAARVVAGTDAGLVQILAKTETPEVHVEVQDSGPGLPADFPGRRIFTLSASARRQGRTGGLHRARQLLRAFATPTTEPDLEVFPSSHPTLTGAALRLVLPEHAP
ncbi:ATP-binding protein [Streptomyces sp. P9(2023)]|uniref:ATP-binding protein n=1 Tax=Streptomyces sp. P9(2023) TaxID=3064394 RepID=UPI0028F4374F|nr:ATP-binding protein [Streptomyces sp. P9(2023)]MDT9693710.1 ATP-binding protein [Streptomyces sp. P9(2023)]